MTEADFHQVFISYARADNAFARQLYRSLREAGFNPWLDTENLRPGQNWDFEINIAIQRSSFIIFLISKNSVDKRGYLQREVKIALEKSKEKLIDDVYIIPILIDDTVELPNELVSIHYILASKPDYVNDVIDSINLQIVKLGGKRREVQEERDLFWSKNVRRENWDGIPGYEYEVELIDFSSETYPNVGDISSIVKAHFLADLCRLRGNKLNQTPDAHSFAKDRWSRTDTYSASCNEPIITNRVLSLIYLVDWYGAGAAHSNHHYKTFCFVLDPMIAINSLSEVFVDPDVVIDEICEKTVCELMNKRNDDGEIILDEDWVREGVKDWDSFPAFSFNKDGIQLLFPPYRVGPYAAGMFDVEISYGALKDHISSQYQIALGIEYLQSDRA